MDHAPIENALTTLVDVQREGGDQVGEELDKRSSTELHLPCNMVEAFCLSDAIAQLFLQLLS
jgi:hypothetical protein